MLPALRAGRHVGLVEAVPAMTNCTCVWVRVDDVWLLVLKDFDCPHVRHRDSDRTGSPIPVYILRRAA